MTCIVGLIHEGKVYLGADSAGVDSNFSLRIRADKKIFKINDFIIGFTTSYRMGQLLNHAFSPPHPYFGDDILKFMATTFVNAVRQCLKDGGYATRNNEVESGGTFLVGYVDRLIKIESDYQVVESIDGYDAIGSGAEVAVGSLFSSTDKPPQVRLRIALEAAEHFSAGVRGPFFYENTEN